MTNLLIVSHNTLQTNIIELALQSPNVEITTIDKSQCVIEVCRNLEFDLIMFLSLSPYFTSMNIVEKLRTSLKRVPPIYVISTSHSASVVLSLLECGVNQYMSFPLNLYRLRDKVFSQIKKS